jgi:hypothetical protein
MAKHLSAKSPDPDHLEDHIHTRASKRDLVISRHTARKARNIEREVGLNHTCVEMLFKGFGSPSGSVGR